jgi:hypothetical protein
VITLSNSFTLSAIVKQTGREPLLFIRSVYATCSNAASCDPQ